MITRNGLDFVCKAYNYLASSGTLQQFLNGIVKIFFKEKVVKAATFNLTKFVLDGLSKIQWKDIIVGGINSNDGARKIFNLATPVFSVRKDGLL